WLLQSIFAHFPAHKGSVAALCFNVKGPDLCFLDQPGAITNSDAEMYELLEVPARPFERVQYYAPYTARGYSLYTLRRKPKLAHNVLRLTWGLSELLLFAEVVLAEEDVVATADAVIDFTREPVLGRPFQEPGFDRTHQVQSFA